MTRSVSIVGICLVVISGCSGGLAAGPAQRAGLGTAWGETRASPVDWISFERDDPERPLAVVTLYYDDADGIRAVAREPGFAFGPSASKPLRVRLVDAWGAPLPTFSRGGRAYAEGRYGDRYAIEIQNRTARRVEAVASVDGLDVIDGGPGSWGKRGYVLEPWRTFRIDGFRQTMHEVAAFRFGAVRESVAAEMGDDSNVGVIGVAFFAERYGPPAWRDRDDEAARRWAADPFPDQ